MLELDIGKYHLQHLGFYSFLVEEKITKKTKCLMLPHIYGLSNDMDKILKIVKKYREKYE